jgi:tetratricopeptide (TPR) repeat protein
VSLRDDSLVVESVLYEVEHPDRALVENRLAIGRPFDERVEGRFALMIDSLVAGGQPAPLPGTSRPFAAVEAFTEGVRAISQWDLTTARDRFRRALDVADGYPAASFRFAQVSDWLEDSPSEWRASAELAARSPALAVAERQHALALLDMADARYPAACGRYRELIGRDSLDFAAWFGLGECNQRDDLVVPNPRDSTKHVFRGSYEVAATAYGRALDILPSAHRSSRELFQNRLRRVLLTWAGESRIGREEHGDTRYAAYPELDHDTVRFLPFPREQLASFSAPTATAVSLALDRNRRLLEGFATKWVRTFPSSSSAWEARAETLEFTGQLMGPSHENALESTRRARSLTAERAAQIRLQTTEVRILVKAGEYRGARLLADSMLVRWRDATDAEALDLAAIAAVVGRVRPMEDYLAAGASARSFIGPRGERLQPPPTLVEPALRLLAFATLGASRDSVEHYERLVRSRIAEWPRDEQWGLSVALLLEPALFGFPFYGPRTLHDEKGAGVSYLLALQGLLSRGDTSEVRRTLAEIDGIRQRALLGPGQVSIDALFQEAWLRLRIADTTSAIKVLDDGLGTLAVQRVLLLRYVQGPAALVQAMALRSRLAQARGDHATARKWAAAVTELWADADSGLAIDLPSLERIASGKRDTRS